MNMAFSDSRRTANGDLTQALRPLGWSELCARLTAAQDLRRHQAGHQAGSGHRDSTGGGLAAGSFHGSAATMLGARQIAQHLVNPTSSINRKANAGTDAGSDEAIADRVPGLDDRVPDRPSRRDLP